jgi:hypothetical protein
MTETLKLYDEIIDHVMSEILKHKRSDRIFVGIIQAMCLCGGGNAQRALRDVLNDITFAAYEYGYARHPPGYVEWSGCEILYEEDERALRILGDLRGFAWAGT